MIAEELMKKYNYGYVHSCELLGEAFVKDLLKENRELKKQLEEINKMIEKCGFVNIEQIMLNYCGLLNQQKEFIDYLEKKIRAYAKAKPFFVEHIQGSYDLIQLELNMLKEILQNYKEIIGVLDEHKTKI